MVCFGVSTAASVVTPAPAFAVPIDVPIVYIRCARTTAEVDITGPVTVNGVSMMKTRHMLGADIHDVMPDVTNFFSNFSAPCDLMYREPSGTERVLFDCSTTSTDAAACAAMDPSVSYDGKNIIFSVFRGKLVHPSENIHPQVLDPLATNTNYTGFTFPNKILQTKEAQLYIVNVATGEAKSLPHVADTIDAGPTYLPDGRITFTSTREAQRRSMVAGTNNAGATAQLWTADPDGRNADLASHHGLGGDEHPMVLRDGRVAYTSWQGMMSLPHRYGNGTVGGFTTIDNLFQLFVQSPDGANPFALYGQHAGDHGYITSIHSSHNAAHFLAQTTDERIWTTDYYRGNNNGLGVVYGFMAPPAGQEGIIGANPQMDLYVPQDMVKLAEWAHNGDGSASLIKPPALTPMGYTSPTPWAGKLGHPAALPNNGLMVAWGKGPCSTVVDNDVFPALGLPKPPLTSGSGAGTGINVMTSLGLDTPACDLGIYQVAGIPVNHPSELVAIVDSRDWHELMARAVVPYAAIHGVEKPTTILRADKIAPHAALPPGTPFGFLGAASITDRETRPVGGIHFQGDHQFQLQGTDTIDYTDDALCGVRIIGVQPNRFDTQVPLHKQLFDLVGERLVILGEIPVRRPGGGMDPSGNLDTSFLVRFPANMPYIMQGIDCDGRTLNTDQTWQSLRPGETKTCGGCHVHTKASRVEFNQTAAAAPNFAYTKLGEGTVPLFAGKQGDTVAIRDVPGDGMQIEFERDIMPILQSRCVSCHSAANPGGDLVLDRLGTDGPMNGNPASTWWCLVLDRSQSCVQPTNRFVTTLGGGAGTTFGRPQVTRYVRAFNALGSLLYWKAAGKRTDGKTDASFDASSPVADRDIDFGAAHPTDITPDELGMLGRWIELGSPGGGAGPKGELQDTSRPTLNLQATVVDQTITELKVGTVDIPSGIDAATLVVCVVAPDGTCGTNLAPAADPHGIVTIPLTAPMGDLEVEIEARVKDKAGNETVQRRTVRYLLDAPLPVDPEDPGASGDGGCCNTGRSGTSAGLLACLVGGLLLRPRRRRTAQAQTQTQE